MKKLHCRAIAILCAFALAFGTLNNAKARGENTGPFLDVPTGEWYYTPVMQAYHLSLITGYPSGNFGPDDDVTRAQVVQILYKRYGGGAKATTSAYTDVSRSAWYANAVAWASQNQIVKGTGNNKFAPDDILTREQMVNILYAKAGRPTINANKELAYYIDYKYISDWAVDAFAWAVKTGLITGKGDGSLDPKGTTSRAQAAAIITRYLKSVDKLTLPEIDP